MKRIPYLGLLLVLLFAGCNREVEPTPKATRTPEPPLGITYCDIDPSDLCLEGFGLEEDEDKMLILFKADDHSFWDIYILADQDQEEVVFECLQSQSFPENVYCLGNAFAEGESIKLNIHAKSTDKFIAEGIFIVEYGSLPEPDVEFGLATPTATVPAPETVSSPTPKPSYPNYPNPSYPNPTSTSTP